MKNACLICGEDLIYTMENTEMECVFCHQKFFSNTSCRNHHYVCDACHSKQAIIAIKEIALTTKSKSPYQIAKMMMNSPYIHMHGNENHTLIGSALLAAYHNAGGLIDLEKALNIMYERSKQVPGGVCGFWGTCGAAISCGIFLSIITSATPLSQKQWGQANTLSGLILKEIGAIGGPRCCKRNGFIALSQTLDFVKNELGIEMEKQDITCDFYKQNNQCIGLRCPFNPANQQ